MKVFLRVWINCRRTHPRHSHSIDFWIMHIKPNIQEEIGMATWYLENHIINYKAWTKELISKTLTEPLINLATLVFVLTKNDQWLRRMLWAWWSIKINHHLSIRSIIRRHFLALSNWTRSKNETYLEVKILMNAPKITWHRQLQQVAPNSAKPMVITYSQAIKIWIIQLIKNLRYSVIKLQCKAVLQPMELFKVLSLKLNPRPII